MIKKTGFSAPHRQSEGLRPAVATERLCVMVRVDLRQLEYGAVSIKSVWEFIPVAGAMASA